MKIRILTASVAALALAACGGDGDEGTGTDAGVNMAIDTGNTADVEMNGLAPVIANGQEYATMVAAGDLFEIESGRLAMEKSQNGGIRELAQMIVADHEKSTADLRAAAGQAQPPVTVTPQLNPEQQANMQALRSANGAQFDQVWLQQQLAAHERALAIVQHYAQNGDVEALKQHAATAAGPIQRHLERVRQLQQQGGGR